MRCDEGHQVRLPCTAQHRTHWRCCHCCRCLQRRTTRPRRCAWRSRRATRCLAAGPSASSLAGACPWPTSSARCDAFLSSLSISSGRGGCFEFHRPVACLAPPLKRLWLLPCCGRPAVTAAAAGAGLLGAPGLHHHPGPLHWRGGGRQPGHQGALWMQACVYGGGRGCS